MTKKKMTPIRNSRKIRTGDRDMRTCTFYTSFGFVWLIYSSDKETCSSAIDFRMNNFTRIEGGRLISYTSTTDNTVKLFI